MFWFISWHSANKIIVLQLCCNSEVYAVIESIEQNCQEWKCRIDKIDKVIVVSTTGAIV